MTLDLFLWIAQVALAGLFGFAGFIKTFRPIPALAKMLVWPGEVPVWLVRFIGVAELAGAVGLILPVLTGILPWLTPLAAAGLAAIQLIAIGFHIARNEARMALPMNLAFLVLAVFAAWGRWDLFVA